MTDARGFSFSRMRAVMIKEFIQLRRDRTTFSMILIVPLMQLILFGYAINTDPKHLPAAVNSRDQSEFARSLVAGLKNSEYFSIDRMVNSEEESRLLLRQGKVQFVITIPEHFGRELTRGTRPKILIEADATDPLATTGALGAVSGIVDTAIGHDLKGPLSSLKSKPGPAEIVFHRSYNPEGLSRYNVVPGLMGIVLTMTGIMMTALAITRERERGTMENLLAMPARPIEVMAGKIAPYVMIGYIQSTIIVLAAKTLFGVPLLGSLFLLSAVLIVFISCNLALGFTLSANAQNQMQAMQMSMMMTLPSILLSGYIFPFRGMPLWAQAIGSLLPVTYFMRIVRGILLKGNGWPEIWPSLWPMMVFMVVITAFAMKRYKQTLD
ncbi:MAG: ABC transporter permease [Alphaproteobacteria bacterium]|nr:MAG: ABC transporter permease [Alphaproteobacteria bacterium]